MKRGSLLLLIIITLSALSSISFAQTCIDADADDYTEDGAAGCTNPGILDCNDNDPNVNPGLSEVPGNGIDDNCDGVVDSQACTDSDKDGYNSDVNLPACAVDGQYDCDDSTSTINPGRAEVSGNGIDDNCNGQIDEQAETTVEELGAEESGGGGGDEEELLAENVSEDGSIDISVVCNPSWDCSATEWSECDPDTNQRTRDTSLCTFTGIGDLACQEDSRAELKSEESCLAAEEAEEEPAPKTKCGNKRCDKGETNKSCPQDCKKSFPWLLVLLIVLLLALIGGGLAYYLMHKKKPAAGAAAQLQPVEKSPFENPNDLNAVLNYIKLSKQRNVPDAKVLEMLRKSGWKDEQIKYAWMKLSQPQAAGSQQKPAQPVQQGQQQKPLAK